MDPEDSQFNAYVGSTIGVLKGVFFGPGSPPIVENYQDFTNENPAKVEIVDMTFNEEEKEILIGFSNNSLKVYSTKMRAFTMGLKLFDHKSPLVGIHHVRDNFYTIGFSDGRLCLWEFGEESPKVDLLAGDNMSKLRHCPTNRSICLTGGKESALRLWDLSNDEKPLYITKNLSHDSLELRRPVWPSDFTFLNDSEEQIVNVTRYGQLRIYDTRANQRPTLNFQFCDHPLISVTTTEKNTDVVAGSSRGTIALLDIRQPGKILKKLRGAKGSVRALASIPSSRLLLSAGLDRFLYLHHLDNPQPLKRLFLKSKLNCILVKSGLEVPDQIEEESCSWANLAGPNDSLGN